MLRLNSSLIKGDGFKQNILDSLCVLAGSWNQLGLRSHQRFVSFFFFLFSSRSCPGYLNNGLTFLPHAVSQIFWGLAQAPGGEPLPAAAALGSQALGRRLAPTSTRLQSSAAVGRSPPKLPGCPLRAGARGEQNQRCFFFSTLREPRPLPTQRAGGWQAAEASPSVGVGGEELDEGAAPAVHL